MISRIFRQLQQPRSVSRTDSMNSSPSPDPNLNRISVSLNRCSSSSVEDTVKRANPKLAKSKKN